MDTAKVLMLPIVLSLFTIFSLYYVSKQIFNKNIGLIASLIYAISTVIIFTDREIAPTQPLHLWTIWFMFSLWLVLNKKNYGYLILGFLIGLIWSINLQLIILVPFIFLAQYFSKRKINKREVILGIIIAFLLNIPFLLFEFRHGFQQSNALISSLTTNKDYIPGTSPSFAAKLDRVMQIVYTNSTNIFWNKVTNIPYQLTFWVINLFLFVLVVKNKINKYLGVIFVLWEAVYILFFSKISLNISEYYLNGMNIIYLLVAAVGINVLIQNKKTNQIGYAIIVFVLTFNLVSFFERPVANNGYIARREVIKFIKEDSISHGYPCVSLSFITNPGNNLGYRYFTWLERLKTKPVSEKVPVYSIVFPLGKVDKVDLSFEGLGLVLPQYTRYNGEEIQNECAGEDYTLTEPMFGFTK